MGLFYILDGYNVLRRIPQLLDHKLKGGRSALLNFLLKYRPQGKNALVIVFDGHGDESGFPGMEVRFSKDDPADDYIIRLVKGLKQKVNCRLVTDDRELGYRVKILGIEVLSVQEFLAGVLRKRRAKAKGYLKDLKEKPDPFSLEAEKIRKELERVWLRGK